MRRAARQMRSQAISLPAPVRGIVENAPIAVADPLAAEFVENFLPTQRGYKVRGGISRAAFVTDPVKKLFSYKAATERLFAATQAAIYDISSLNPDTAASAAVSSLTSGDWAVQQIGVAGGDFLVCVNGADNMRQYNGSAWATITGVSTPAAITGVNTALFSHVWLYKSRLFFVERDSLKAWYLDAGSVSGAASDISLAGVFRRGGSLLMGATWSLDSGDGLDDKCVFVSTEGEVAIYGGDDPSTPGTGWALEGRYDIGKPLSKSAVMRAGGDVLIATDDGIVPLSQVVQKDPAALSLAAVTRDIPVTWREEVERHTGGAELLKWTDENVGLVVLPDADRMLTVNLQTGAWAEQSGWFGDCAAEFNGDVYIGREDGRVYKLNDTGTDDGAAFVCRLCYSFNDMGDPAAYKVVNMARAAWFADGQFAYRLGIATDYRVTFPAAPSAVDAGVTVTGLVWGTGNWGEEVWGGTVGDPPTGRQDQWRAASGAGFAIAPTVVLTSGSATKLDVEFLRVDINAELGGRAA